MPSRLQLAVAPLVRELGTPSYALQNALDGLRRPRRPRGLTDKNADPESLPSTLHGWIIEVFSKDVLARFALGDPDPLAGPLPTLCCATRMQPVFVAGVDVKIVSERLGHSSPLITWQTYQHVIKGMQSDAAERVAALIFGSAP
jgi:hypothetical protein